MTETYPFSIPSGTNIIPASSGVSIVGSVAFPLSGIFAATINGSTIVHTRLMEEPVGLVNGSNQVFTLSHAPYQYSLALYKNGMLTLQSGVHTSSIDYTLSSGSITFVSAPASGSIIVAQSYGYL